MPAVPSPPPPSVHPASAFRLQPQVEAVAPAEPLTTRMREAEIISNRVGGWSRMHGRGWSSLSLIPMADRWPIRRWA